MPEPSISNHFGLSPTPVPTDTLVPPITTETSIATGMPASVTPGTPTSLVQKIGEIARGTFFGGAPSGEALPTATPTPTPSPVSTPIATALPPIEPSSTAEFTFPPSVPSTPTEIPATIAAVPTTEPTPTLTPVSSVPPEAAIPIVPISGPQVIVPPEFGGPSDVPEPPTLLSNTFPAPEPFAPTAPTQSEIMPSGAPVEQLPSIEEKIASLPDTIQLEDGSNPFAATLELMERETGRELTREEHKRLLPIVYQLCVENQLAVPVWELQGKPPTTGSQLNYSDSVKKAILDLAANLKQNPQIIGQ